ncbi:MAG TPA: hypothetical protein VE685_23895 [Thermoanaerobaculia bacterium]|nr:hypothetical protein [Thermoanaerobaculia bacterium]
MAKVDWKSRVEEIERILGPLIARRAKGDLVTLGLPTYTPPNMTMTLSQAIMLERGRPEDLIAR